MINYTYKKTQNTKTIFQIILNFQSTYKRDTNAKEHIKRQNDVNISKKN